LFDEINNNNNEYWLRKLIEILRKKAKVCVWLIIYYRIFNFVITNLESDSKNAASKKTS